MFLGVCLIGRNGLGGDLETIGVTELRGLDASLIGTGVPVAQPEALADGVSQFEIDPANVDEPESLFDWISTNGNFTVFPNSAGTDSPHADAVAANFFGPSQGVATGVGHVDNQEADYFFQYVVAAGVAVTDTVVNQSFAFFPTNVADQVQIDSNYDNYTADYGTLFSSAVNGLDSGVGPPGTAYNCVGVGAYGVGAVVTQGPTLDNGRSKPDIVAPGTETSFTTPYVSGAAAVLLQAAWRGDGGPDTAAAADWRTIKALLLTGALKPFDWAHTTNAPLDINYGAGVLNLFYSYEQLAAGRQTYSASGSVASGSAHPPVSTGTIASLLGWDFETITNPPGDDTVNHYVFKAAAAGTLTATLDWERPAAQTDINHLALFLYNATNGALQTCSVSAVDNVQHLYLPHLPAGTYDLEAIKYGGAQSLTPSEEYALAYQFYPLTAPALTITPGATNAVITWPSSPTVFVLQGTGSLATPALWTNVTAQEWITNGTVWVGLGEGGADGFYRLVR